MPGFINWKIALLQKSVSVKRVSLSLSPEKKFGKFPSLPLPNNIRVFDVVLM